MNIVVIGAGIVGLTTAWTLQAEGHQVTLIDRANAVGQGTSLANGGQLSYRYIAPLADPDVLGKIPGWMLRSDAPVRFRPRFDPDQWRWILSFLKACNTSDKLRSVAALLPLALYSQSLIHALAQDSTLDFDYRRNGKLIIHRDRATFESARRLLAGQPELAEEQQALDAQACIDLEPSLAGLRGEIVGGIHTRSEEAGDCHKLCQALAAGLSRGKQPATLLLSETVEGFEVHQGRLSAVITDKRRLAPDACVMAGGVESVGLLKPLGISVPIYPLKGYSLNIPIHAANAVPDASVTDFQRKIVYARLGQHLRVAGMADIVGFDTGLNARRLADLQRETAANFGKGLYLDRAEPWAGLRPATPSGRPIVDATRIPGLWLNVGHGALGFTLAAGCAQLLADRMMGRQPAIPDEGFLLANAQPEGWLASRQRHAG